MNHQSNIFKEASLIFFFRNGLWGDSNNNMDLNQNNYETSEECKKSVFQAVANDDTGTLRRYLESGWWFLLFCLELLLINIYLMSI